MYLSGLCDAGQSLMVPFPDGHLQGGQAGLGLGWGSGLDKAAPLSSHSLPLYMMSLNMLIDSQNFDLPRGRCWLQYAVFSL